MRRSSVQGAFRKAKQRAGITKTGVAIHTLRIVSLTDRTVTFTYRKVGRTRLRTAHLDGMEFLRRFLQHILPEGFMKVRPCGFMHASAAIHTDTIRQMIVPAHPSDAQPPQRPPPQPLAVRCPTRDAPMRIVMRLWTSHRDFADTDSETCLSPDALRTTRFAQPTAPVRRSPGIRPHKAAARASATAFQCPADALQGSSEAPRRCLSIV